MAIYQASHKRSSIVFRVEAETEEEAWTKIAERWDWAKREDFWLAQLKRE